MTADIVERLRVSAAHPYNQHGPHEFLTEAADIIERLRVELARINRENDRLIRTNRAKREHRDKLLAEIGRLKAAVTPRPIEEAPKNREVIGVERPPGEDRNFYRMVKWDDEKNAWVTQVDIDWSVRPAKVIYAVCHGVSHFIHPDAVPLLPEEIVEGSDDE